MAEATLVKEPMTEANILNVIKQELAQSLGSYESDSVAQDRINALNAYLGGPNGKEMEGRSKVTSTDVADVIEWIMPEVMKALTQGKDVIQFDPVYPGDERQAEIETAFVYDILMKDNDGFTNIYQMCKDALLQRNGIIKVIIEEDNNDKVVDYTDLMQEELSVLLNDINCEVIQLTDRETIVPGIGPIKEYDCKAIHRIRKKKVKCIPIAPELFRVNKHHPNVNLDEARFVADIAYKTRSDLISEGYDKSVIDTIPTLSDVSENNQFYRFYLQGESATNDTTIDPAEQLVEVAECYIKIDMDGTGVAERKKITVAGASIPGKILSIEDCDDQPYVSGTAILMSHKFLGLSIYDRIKQIQEQKTQLLRNQFDNIYFQNNGRLGVVKGQVELDDLLVSRPGGIIRMNNANAVVPITTPNLGDAAYQMIQYLDNMRADRTGASPDAQVDPTQVGDRVGSQGIARLMNAKEELVGLMIRCLAETGIKPICFKIRELAVKHLDTIQPYKFKGKWAQVDPSRWMERTRCTITVGTGAGNRVEKQGAMQTLLQIQNQILQNPNQALVDQPQIFNAINDLARSFALPGADPYFLDPSSPEGQSFAQKVQQGNQAKQQTDQQVAMAPVVLAQAENTKAETNRMEVGLKHQIALMKEQLIQNKELYTIQIKLLETKLNDAKMQLEAATRDANLQLEYDKLNSKNAIDTKKISVDAGEDDSETASDVKENEDKLEESDAD